MKKAIEFLRTRGIMVSRIGIIFSELSDGIDGIALTDELEEYTETLNYCYTIKFSTRINKYIVSRLHF